MRMTGGWDRPPCACIFKEVYFFVYDKRDSIMVKPDVIASSFHTYPSYSDYVVGGKRL